MYGAAQTDAAEMFKKVARHIATASPVAAPDPNRKIMDQPVSATTLNALATEDWDCLFRAVLARLRLARGSTQEIQPAVILECVDALEKLHAMAIQERRQDMASTMRALVVARFTQRLKPAKWDRPLRDMTGWGHGALSS